MDDEIDALLGFWFSSAVRAQWFAATPALDAQIRHDYERLWRQARDGQRQSWLDSAPGCLALILVLDQLPLNMFRGKAESFSTEAQAIAVTRHAIASGFDAQIERDRLGFLYMPLMHSESRDDQDQSVALYEAAGLAGNLDFARHHREIIRRFGRFPHRNAILGRSPTAQELDWLQQPGSFTG